jgi:hypothetical protein
LGRFVNAQNVIRNRTHWVVLMGLFSGDNFVNYIALVAETRKETG